MNRILSIATVALVLGVSSLSGAQAGPRFGGGFGHAEHFDRGFDHRDFDRGDRGFDRRGDRRDFDGFRDFRRF